MKCICSLIGWYKPKDIPLTNHNVINWVKITELRQVAFDLSFAMKRFEEQKAVFQNTKTNIHNRTTISSEPNAALISIGIYQLANLNTILEETPQEIQILQGI